MSIQVGVHRTSDSATIPTKGTEHAACFDIYADLRGVVAQTQGIQIITRRDDIRGLTYGNATKLEFIPQDDKIILRPNDRALIPTGLIFDIPHGYCIKMYPRSGASTKRGLTLTNAVGIIDSDYTHESFIPIINISDKTQFITHGERLAQIELSEVLSVEFIELENTISKKSDRSGGFGSTGA